MNRHSLSWLVSGAGVVVALLVANVALTFTNIRQLHDDAYWVAHTREVLTGLENVLSLAKDAETGQRGFVITGEPRYLERYNAALAAIDKQVDDLERLTEDNPHQQARFPELRGHIAAKLKELDHTIALRKNDGFAAARRVVLTDRGKKEMDALRVVIGEMIQHEQDRLRDRSRKSEQTYRMAVFTGLLSGLSALAGVGAFLVLLGRHLTSRTKAAAVIAEQGERLRTTLASIGDAVITTDTEGRVTNLNAVAESLTGWKNDEAAGQLLEAVFRIVNEATRQPVEEPAIRALKEGVIVGLANHTVLLAKDGTERPIDDSAAPIRCTDGEIVGCVLVFRDVTDRRKAEQRLSRSEQRLRFVLDSMPQKIFTAMPSGDVDYFNPQWTEFTGLSFEQIKGWGWKQFIHPDDVAENVRVWKRSIDTGEPFSFEHRFRRADDAYRWHISRAKALTDAEGKILMWVGSNTDIHEQKQTAEDLRKLSAELSEADRRKDEFLAMLAHELRNPLAPLRNGLQIMRLSSGSGTAAEQARAMMERQLGQMVHLVDDLLDVSRISRGKLELRKERVELAAVLNNAVETSRPLIDSSGHQLTVRLPSEPVLVDADVTRLGQVFANLLQNAAKYSERGGRIGLTAERQGSDVAVSVTDTGVGIPPDMLPRIFDMFAQVDRSLERSQGGLGIGLTLVKRLVEMHGGSVEAKSEGHGRGSEFVVRLPVVSSLVEEVEPPTETGQPICPSAQCRILVADDNEDSAASLAMMLQIMGNEVRTAKDGLQAVEAAAAFQPDVILLDIGMPRLNGYEACRRIREQPGGQKAVLIALTGWGQDEDKRRSAEAGFHHHLVKPVDPAALGELLAGLQTTTE